VRLPLPTKTGYTFLGWYNGNWKLISAGNTSYTPTSSETLTARWSAKQYTIYYNANGGTGSMSTTTATYDQSATLRSNNFSRVGWTFLGWSTNKNATSPDYSNAASVKNLTGNNSVTLYAVWSLKTSYTYTGAYFNVPWDKTMVYSMYLDEVFDYNYLRSEGYNISVSVSYTAINKGDTSGYIQNDLVANDLIYGYQSPKTKRWFTYTSSDTFGHFKSNQYISWAITIPCVSEVLEIRFHSGNVHAILPLNADCVPYDVSGLTVTITFHK